MGSEPHSDRHQWHCLSCLTLKVRKKKKVERQGRTKGKKKTKTQKPQTWGKGWMLCIRAKDTLKKKKKTLVVVFWWDRGGGEDDETDVGGGGGAVVQDHLGADGVTDHLTAPSSSELHTDVCVWVCSGTNTLARVFTNPSVGAHEQMDSVDSEASYLWTDWKACSLRRVCAFKKTQRNSMFHMEFAESRCQKNEWYKYI